MAIKKTDDTHYKNIANAIREKNGLTDYYYPADMAGEILALPKFVQMTQAEYDALTVKDENVY